MHTGNKFISVKNGHIDIHGQERSHTFTLLSESVSKGDTSIVLDDEVDWQVGETIVVPSTSYEMDEAESFVIKERTSATEFVLDHAFEYDH